MTELLTAAQMRSLEQAAIASGEVTGLELMERAGRGVVEAILDEWPEFREGTHRAVVLCGPGNNGGDGFVVARLLREAGWAVEVFLHGDATKLPPDARVNYDRWAAVGAVNPLEMLSNAVDARPGMSFDLIIDALFGIGLRRALPDLASGIFCDIFRTYLDGRVVSIDVPSGLCADSGRPLVPEDWSERRWAALEGYLAVASLTVTFHRAKPGHVLNEGPRHCGKLVVKDIGLRQARDPSILARMTAKLCGPRTSAGKGRETHKYTHGHALILSGPATRTGAARLAARGALRIGAGLVTVACPPDAAPEHAARLDAVMLRPIADAPALSDLLADPRINAVCAGPGLGLDAHAAALIAATLDASAPPPPSPPHEGEGGRVVVPGDQVPAAGASSETSKPDATLATSASPPPRGEGMGAGGAAPAISAALTTSTTPTPKRRVVLDADALTLLARDPALMAQLHANCVLTPHAGEFARLFPDIAARLDAIPTTGPAYSKVDATRDAAARAGCTVLFKGPDTVIADPSGRCSINSAHYDRAAPWLATAGSGDVLAGFITGLLARGFSPHDAAATAAWLHVECALSFGPGLIAEDLPEELPKVFRALGV